MGQSEIINMLKAVATEHNVKVNEVMKLMRSSLTGLKVCYIFNFVVCVICF